MSIHHDKWAILGQVVKLLSAESKVKCDACFTSLKASFCLLESDLFWYMIAYFWPSFNCEWISILGMSKRRLIYFRGILPCSRCPCLSAEQFYAELHDRNFVRGRQSSHNKYGEVHTTTQIWPCSFLCFFKIKVHNKVQGFFIKKHEQFQLSNNLCVSVTWSSLYIIKKRHLRKM